MQVTEAFLCAGVRTPIGRYAGALSAVRPDDLAAHVIGTLVERSGVPAEAIDEVYCGCVNQAGEDNRNIARMASLIAGLPPTVPGVTVNRLCGSGLEAIGQAARAVRLGEADLVIASGAESMSRAPFVFGKGETPFARNPEFHDTTIGWRFVNPAIESRYGIESMPETAENIAAEHAISREDQDAFALRSQQRALAAVSIPRRKGDPIIVDRDEHPRQTSLEQLAKLPAPFRQGGTVTAGNASGVNDGAAALLVASQAAVKRFGLTPLARISGMATAGVEPRVMGMGPVPATRLLLKRLGKEIGDIELIELNEAFAAQALGVMRQLGIPDDADFVNPNGGAIALGHPLGASGVRIALSAALEMSDRQAGNALCTMCIGVGQGIALMLERA
jgi:3-oxoadipyl-CoA thiolase